jgi:hypothetical protein
MTQHEQPPKTTWEQDAAQKQAEILAVCGGSLPRISELAWLASSQINKDGKLAQSPLVAVYGSAEDPTQRVFFVAAGYKTPRGTIHLTLNPETEQPSSVLVFTNSEWRAFTEGVKEGEFDIITFDDQQTAPQNAGRRPFDGGTATHITEDGNLTFGRPETNTPQPAAGQILAETALTAQDLCLSESLLKHRDGQHLAAQAQFLVHAYFLLDAQCC